MAAVADVLAAQGAQIEADIEDFQALRDELDQRGVDAATRRSITAMGLRLDRRHAAHRAAVARAEGEQPPVDPVAEPGDTVIELRDGVPWIGTA